MGAVRTTTVRRVAGVAAAGVVASVAAVGLAWSASAADSPTGGGSGGASTPASGAHHRAGLLRGLEHGQVTVRRGQRDVVLDLQRGTVTAVTPTSISVRSLDGVTSTATVDGSTKVRKDGKPAAIGDVHVGDRAQVVSTQGKGLRVADRAPAHAGGATG
jgi:hypothetical protein